MDDYRIMMCKQSLVDIINEVQLPASVIAYILKDIQQEIDNIISRNIEQAKEKNKKEENSLNYEKQEEDKK